MYICARIHDRGQMLGLITCREHGKFLTNHTTSGPGERRKSRCLGQSQKIQSGDKTLLKIAARATMFSDFAPLLTGA